MFKCSVLLFKCFDVYVQVFRNWCSTLAEIRTVFVTARQKVYSTINSAMVEAYWEIRRQIMEVQEGQRAEYGTGLIKYLAERLTKEFGKGFDESSLRRMRNFFQVFPIRATLSHELSWSHYRLN